LPEIHLSWVHSGNKYLITFLCFPYVFRVFLPPPTFCLNSLWMIFLRRNLDLPPLQRFLVRAANTENQTVRHFPQMEGRFDRSRTNRLNTGMNVSALWR
jgi:hypothetical protein